MRINKINKRVVLASPRSKIPAKQGVRAANRREICRAAIGEDKHALEFKQFFNLPLFSSTLHTLNDYSIAYILTGVTGKLEFPILLTFHNF